MGWLTYSAGVLIYHLHFIFYVNILSSKIRWFVFDR